MLGVTGCSPGAAAEEAVLHGGLHGSLGLVSRLSGVICKVMSYLIAFQLLCACFAGYVASQKGRNWFFWFLAGFAVPILGVILAVTVKKPRRPQAEKSEGPGASTPRLGPRRRPSRCCGDYIADCQGCSYFQKPLFDLTYSGSRKGWCELFHKVLTEPAAGKGTKIVLKDD